MPPTFTFEPIGIVHSPLRERASAPRQPAAAAGIAATIELFAGRGFEHALEDLAGWDYLWVLFVFHLNEGWRPKVLPPRSTRRRGVFSTRAPHRPNPIGMSAVRLERVEGLILHVRDVDILDGTPVLDVKPYVPYADAFPSARTGWLAPLATGDDAAPPRDPEPGFEVVFAEPAREQARWLAEEHGVPLGEAIAKTLALGPQPHPYRRIRRDGDGFRLAIKEWRVRFRLEGRLVTVESIATGHRPADLASDDPALDLHRAFVARFARGGSSPPS